MKKDTFTLTLCQFPISFLNWDENRAQAVTFIEEASRSDTTLLLFPEMCLTGISPVEAAPMTDFSGKNLAFFQEMAKTYHLAIGFGWGKEHLTKGKLENHYTVVDENGEILSDYVKIHPFTYGGEDKFFVRGRDYTVFEYRGMKIATFICYDLRFPEIFQAASRDCDMILLGANWPKPRNMHWKILSQARAIENQVYLAVCNCVGEIGGLDYSGDSTIYRPDGEIMGRLSDLPGLISCQIPYDVATYRKAFPVKQDRMVDYYKEIL